MKVGSWLGTALLFAGGEASADPIRHLAWDPALDGVVTGGAAAFVGTAELLKPVLVPRRCRWCASNAFDEGVRDALVWDRTGAADAASTWIAFGIPVSTIGLSAIAAAHDRAFGGVATDALLAAEATLLAADANELVKLAAGRKRPWAAHAGVHDHDDDEDLSFYSGHTNLAFAVATSTGTIALLRGYRLAPLVLGVGLAGASVVGWLRIAADKHWLTDVIVGAVLGSAFGVGVPLLFHAARGANESGRTAAPLVISGTW